MKYNLFLAFALLFSTLCTLCADERPLLKAGIHNSKAFLGKGAGALGIALKIKGVKLLLYLLRIHKRTSFLQDFIGL